MWYLLSDMSSQAFLIDDDPNNIGFVGNRTECALLMLARKWGIDYRTIRAQQEKNIAKVNCPCCCLQTNLIVD